VNDYTLVLRAETERTTRLRAAHQGNPVTFDELMTAQRAVLWRTLRVKCSDDDKDHLSYLVSNSNQIVRESIRKP
jgi:hypothetical protein